ncbi:MAG: glycosyltransferase family 1 protein [Alphaproteobacteria bacterium]|nr:glycosyltransferase family 1 protein [Alphaproteobacteria bacterium]
MSEPQPGTGQGIGAPAHSAGPGPAQKLRILIVTDAWAPQVNGVVRTLEMLGTELRALGHEVRYATPEGRPTFALPSYPEIRLAIFPRRGLEALFDTFRPDAIHIATEGTMGLSARAICLKRGLTFSTSYHTRFPEYVRARVPVPESLLYGWLRWFHRPASAVMVATPTLLRELTAKGFANLRLWSRGVDVDRFKPIAGAELSFPRPIWLYVGRVAVEKNIETFLALDLPGTKVVVGDGPARAKLSKTYPQVKFLGEKSGEDLVRAYSASDVFVFPSLTDTFGLVMLEAMACGLPVAASPASATRDVLAGARFAVIDADLGSACLRALSLKRETSGENESPRDFALGCSWRHSTEQFLSNIKSAAA